MLRIWILIVFQLLIVAAFLVAIFQWESTDRNDRSRAIGGRPLARASSAQQSMPQSGLAGLPRIRSARLDGLFVSIVI
jgi:hypothetical protein